MPAMVAGTSGQQLSLAVAAAIAYHQLTGGRAQRFYDADHLSETFSLVAHALIRVAPVEVLDGGQRRALTETETVGLTVSRGATRITLQDGRVLSEPTIRRGELRDAIVILKAAGLDLLSRASRVPLKS